MFNTIKARLNLVTGLIVSLVVVIFSLFLYANNTYSELQQGKAQVLKIKAGMLMLRRNEKDFLARNNLKYLKKFEKNHQKILQDLQFLESILKNNDLSLEKVTLATAIFNQYKVNFITLTETQKLVGLDHQSGLQGRLRKSVHQVESKIKVEKNDILMAQMLMLRRREKDFLLRFDLKYLKKFNKDINKFQTLLTQSELASDKKRSISQLMVSYQQDFHSMVQGYVAKGLSSKLGIRGKMRATVHKTETILQDMQVTVSESIATAIINIKTIILVVASLLTLLIIGINFRISKTISDSARHLADTVKKIEETGDFSIRINNDSGDEIGQISTAIDQLLGSTKSMIINTGEIICAISNGDFNRQIENESKGDLEQMRLIVNLAAQRIHGAMQALVKNIENLSQGNFERVNSQVDLQGEYLIAVDNTQNVVQTLKQIINEINQVMGSVAENNLSGRVEVTTNGAFTMLKDNVNQSLYQLSETLSYVSDKTDFMLKGASQTDEATSQISDGAQQQLDSIGQISEALSQTQLAIEEVTNSAQEAGESAAHVVEQVKSGMVSIKNMKDIMESIKVNSIKIDKITDVIGEIAEKTNMLSLNAAIEAARAGEAGKGFSVVADEVRKLSEHVASSANEINSLVKEANEDVENGVKLVVSINDFIQQIDKSVRDNDEHLHRIVSSMEQQNSTTTELNANASSLNYIAENNAAAAEELHATALDLSKTADVINDKVSQFTLAKDQVA
ncbi:MAG: methyl-accepting chemotaxis protein [Methylococcales bacterium]|nr:methyl-accepting chemotaxis protein [Methylococcales bacterium]